MNNTFVHSYVSLCNVFGVNRLPKFRSMSGRCNFVKKWMVKHYEIETSEINMGYCFIFAYLVAALTPHNIQFVTNHGHVVVYDPESKRYYESRKPSGIEKVSRIDGMGRSDDKEVPHYVMTLLWANRGRKGEEFREVIKVLDPKDPVCKLKEVDHWLMIEEAIVIAEDMELSEKVIKDQLVLDFV